MKILHCSDLHLGRRPVGGMGEYSQARFNDYFESFDDIASFACSGAVDVVVIPGDVFDRREISPEILEKAEIIFQKLKDCSIETVISEGNHDRGGSEGSSWLDYLLHRGLVRIPRVFFNDGEYSFTFEEIGSVRFYSLGYPGIYVNEMLEAFSRHLDVGGFYDNILLLHSAVGGGDFLPGLADADAVRPLKGKVLYVAGGHLHSYKEFPKDDPFFFVPGSPEYWDIAEGDEKYFLIFDTATRALVRRKTKKRERVVLRNKIEAVSEDDFFDSYSRWVDEQKIAPGSIVLCTLRLSRDIFPDSGKCEKLIESRGAVKAKVSFEYDSSSDEKMKGMAVSAGVIESEKLKDSGFSAQLADLIVNDYMPRMKNLQAENSGDADSFFHLFDSMIDAIKRGQA